MPKENLIFKLDNLEYQFHYLNSSLETFDPRLTTTKKLFTMKGQKNIKNWEKKLNSTTIPEIEAQLEKLKQEIVTKKIFHLQKKLSTNLEKYSANSKSETPKEIYDHIIQSKIVKLTVNKLLYNKALKQDPPSWVSDLDVYQVFKNQDHLSNPTYVYKNHLSANKQLNNHFSKFIGDKKQTALLKEFESGMDTFLNINKGKKEDTAAEPQNKQKTKRASSDSEDSEDENVGTGSDVDEDELLKQYEGMVALSEDEDGDAEKDGDVTLNSDVDYNQVTDLEPSEVDDDDDDDDDDLDEEEQPSKKKQKTADDKKKDKKEKKKTVLPALEYGFIDQDGYSGDEEDVEEDPFFEDIKPKKVVKNRKGQRQRRLLWEKKYGKEAKHIQVEITKRRGEREQRQKEFEEREAKRHERMKEKFEHDRAKYVKKKEFESKDFHPSWEAKKAQEEKTKNIKFSGKKVVFD